MTKLQRQQQRAKNTAFYHQARTELLPLAKRCCGTILAGFDGEKYSVCFSRGGAYTYISRDHHAPDAAIADVRTWLEVEEQRLQAWRDVLYGPGAH